MLSLKEKRALDRIKQIDDIETRLAQLFEDAARNVAHPTEIIRTYVRRAREELAKKEQQLSDKRLKVLRELDEERGKLSHTQKMIEENFEAIDLLCQEKSRGFPWLAEAYADYSHLRDMKLADWLVSKDHPAKRSAELLREMSLQKRELGNEARVVKYILKMYESLFPFLVDFRGEDLDDYIRARLEPAAGTEAPVDSVAVYTTEGERDTLSKQEVFQRALDRYWQRRKRPWEIGRDYERYVGYLYEVDGYSVYYQGIVEGFEDLGRDLVARKGEEVAIVQCKCWSRQKTIHEKHICQLFGTTLKYWVDNRSSLRETLKTEGNLFPKLLHDERIKAVFVTSTTLSETAREFARELGVTVREQLPLERYPAIKCNVSRKTGERIYHLPFDQQYDRTIVEEQRNECYVETVEEAEGLGFRRAFRWAGLEEGG